MVKKLMESRRTLRNVLIGSLSLLLDRDLMRLLPSFSLLLCLPFFSLFLFLARPAADHSAHTPIITPFQYSLHNFMIILHTTLVEMNDMSRCLQVT